MDMRREVWEEMALLGIFVRNMKEHLCLGAENTVRVDCSPCIYRGMYEYLINESQAQGKCNKRGKASPSQTRIPCPAIITQLGGGCKDRDAQ